MESESLLFLILRRVRNRAEGSNKWKNDKFNSKGTQEHEPNRCDFLRNSRKSAS
jgi:hypothetical protein